MGASKKLSGKLLGPPQEGDLFLIREDEKGEPKLHSVSQNITLDLGIISELAPFRAETLVTKGITTVEGIIVDKNGSPQEGMVVFAFQTPTMMGRPLFVSDRSGKDGKYFIRLHSGGSYYLSARTDYGGGPLSTNHLMGTYEKEQPLKIMHGDTKTGIDITVTGIGPAE